MCIIPKPPKPPEIMPTPAPVQPIAANTKAMDQGELPGERKTIDPDAVKTVEYGSSAKEGGPAAGNRRGTNTLRIDVNTGAGQSGGLNV